MFRNLVKNSSLLLMQYAVSSLVPLLLVPHVVRTIGVDAFGHLAVALAWGMYAAVTVQYGFQLTGPALVAAELDKRNSSQVFAELTTAKLVLFGAVSSVWAIAYLACSSLASSWATWLIVLVLPVAAVANSAWYLQARGHFMIASIASVAGALTALSLGIWLVDINNPRAMEAAAVALTAGPVVTAFLTVAFSLVVMDISAWPRRPIAPLRAIAKGWPLFSSQIAASLYMLSGPIVIGVLANERSAGQYATVERFINGIAGACLLTHVAAYPRLAELFVRDRIAYRRLLRIVVGCYLCMTSCIAVMAWTFRDKLLHFMFGVVPQGVSTLLAWALGWLVAGIFGAALTGYLVVRARVVDPAFDSHRLAASGSCRCAGGPLARRRWMDGGPCDVAARDSSRGR